ncbi:MAG: hypothetical protein COV34_01075 [Candidatus Zambryskibacteria bacterium CG10_big_fil_rev_8_21_14_0_10_42_12]|uniref:AI-2E family transporter n=1 Tax=Candidatus Zambryskibacteria bacterium CG10_big_fil_rev_8_21_14_0_10_42_12 TaxID=1975115 RepID=A0A2H0QX55_9BACT|nr:MAG: hypothetical protein COV34_01075 [Candidatus Zambryskibacteria bacterium CG10_big_fil_rev_8_21_14_0_10_42_12]
MTSEKHLRLFWVILILLIGIILAFFVFKPFLAEIFLAIVLAIVAHPLYTYVRKVIPSAGLASFATTILVLLVIIIPVSLLGVALVKETVSFATNITNSGESLAGLVQNIDNFFARVIPYYKIDTLSIESASTYIEDGVLWFVQNLQGIFSNIFEWLVSTAIMLVALYYLFKDGSKLYEGVLYISPLDDAVDKKIGHEIATIMRAVILGRIFVGVIQGLAAYVGFLFFGIENPLLLTALVIIVAILPLIGTLFVLAPVALYQFAIGATLPAVGILLWGIFIVGLVDNVVGPIFIHGKTRLHPFAILVSILGGIHMFGLVGFVAGPVLLGVVYALFKMLPLVYGEIKPKKRVRSKKTA